MTNTLQKIKQYWPLILLTIYVAFSYLVYINLFNSDIGRHIANGREFFSGSYQDLKLLLTTNYYSYTQTNYTNINHHWLFGVVVYLVHQLGGFKLLSWFNMLVNTVAYSFILLSSLKTIGKKNNLAVVLSSIVGFLTIPLLTHRLEVRPETFSMLFFAMYFFLFTSKKIQKNKAYLFLVIATQIFWVNTHLFFILGPLLAGYFLFKEMVTSILEKKNKINKNVKFWLGLVFSLLAVSLINPHTVNGLLEPFNIFNDYEYRVAENQSTIFMINYGSNVNFYTYVIVISLIGIGLSFFSTYKKHNASKKISQIILLTIFVLLANKINRMTPFLAVFLMPFLSHSIYSIVTSVKAKYKKTLQNSIFIMIVSSVSFIGLVAILSLGFFTPNINRIGTGLYPNSFTASNFIKDNNIKGPIFNNYDVGGYLAYNLFPQEHLFIDNRPEAYSNDFLQNEFLESLKNENSWKTLVDKYNFNLIFFYRHDAIDGAQEFLYNRVKDDSWIPVFVDEFSLILVKNSSQNQQVIDEHALPNEIFGMNKSN